MLRTLRVLIAEPLNFSAEALRILEGTAEVELRHVSASEFRQAFGEYEVCWFRLAHRVDRDVLSSRGRCRVLATPVTGLDHIDLAACKEMGVKVVSLRGEVEFLKEVRATAELTVGLALSLLRRIPEAAASVKAGMWDRDLFRGRELYGKTAGLIGMGRLGTIVAGYLRAFDMRVIGYDPRPDFPHGAADRADSLEELLLRSDLVSLHVSYDETTRHLLGRREIGLMKKGAVLINTSRGGVVDEDALIEALDSGRLAGAALDVLEGEPSIDAGHKMVAYARAHENLLVVPHIGGNTSESFEKTEIFLARRVVEALRDEAPR